MQKYPRGSRGSPAKGVVWETVARVRISSSAPKKGCPFGHPFFGTQDEPLGFVRCSRLTLILRYSVATLLTREGRKMRIKISSVRYIEPRRSALCAVCRLLHLRFLRARAHFHLDKINMVCYNHKKRRLYHEIDDGRFASVLG